uniref:DUF4178 domain-containing protein n=1 Tax=Candidatus Kentrum sp. FM TaxID=2126340 RepID=A0A450U2Q0_9GAMM|nr:MAG: hypothetical protein BECKFM1743C_GA0114222_107153 [Candidatus Kentron sp. FM]VFJ77384.1 MAG: hypothetical protein BECKFM1743A_GA0114220_109801 [Candidatus Kentron sp. FM]VFK20781.1 MAG: hypothetical protein BECKFM1743B_GA0114221_107282 [Candidatus Kentron sp. FM]
MSLLKSLFRSRQEAGQDTSRVLEHPKDLQLGDIVEFGFTGQQRISNQSLRVEDIDTCDLGGEQHKKTVFTLRGTGTEEIRLAVVDNGQGERIELGCPVFPEDVARIFDQDAFIDLLDPETGVHHILERDGEPEQLAGWTASVYRQEAGHNAYYHPGDYRFRQLPDFEEDNAFSYYFLVSDDRQFGLEVQVYDGGRTNVYLLVYLPISRIEELWPGGA